MNIDGVERHFGLAILIFHQMQPHHHHPGDPEKDDIEPGDQNVGLVIALKLWRLFRPPERRERPQSGGKPGVEDVRVAGQNFVFAIMIIGQGFRLSLIMGNEDFAIRPVPCRNPMPPPELARNAPGLDVAHPLKVSLLPVFGNKFGFSALHRLNGGLG